MTLHELLSAVEPLAVKGPTNREITGLCYDSRKAVPGSLFVAVPGHKSDGADFVADALSRGATAVVSELFLDPGSEIAVVQVEDAREALAKLSARFFGTDRNPIRVVGVTGTNGKTTTAYMTRAVLRAGGFNPGLLGTVAYEIGDHALPAVRTTPEAPEIHHFFQQMRDAGCDSAVMEVSSHALALKRTEGIPFEAAVFTNLSQDHLDYHENMDAYFRAKSILFRNSERAAVINLDDPWGKRLIRESTARPVVTFGFSDEADLQAREAKIRLDGTGFLLCADGETFPVKLPLPGRFNIHNALAALAVGRLFGVPFPSMISSLEELPPVPGRLERIANRKKRAVFVDYAHTDDALRKVLRSLREVCEGRLIVVFGCGGDRDRGKRPLMGRAADELADYAILTSDNPRNEDPAAIAVQIAEGFSTFDRFEIEIDRRKAIEKGIKMMKRKDILLVAGKGHETYQESRGTIVPFDDRETVREILG